MPPRPPPPTPTPHTICFSCSYFFSHYLLLLLLLLTPSLPLPPRPHTTSLNVYSGDPRLVHFRYLDNLPAFISSRSGPGITVLFVGICRPGAHSPPPCCQRLLSLHPAQLLLPSLSWCIRMNNKHYSPVGFSG